MQWKVITGMKDLVFDHFYVIKGTEEKSAVTLTSTYIHTYIHKLYLSSDFSVAYIASISDPNLLIKSYNIII